MYAPALYQAKYLVDVWKIPAEKYGVMNVVTAFSILASLFWSGIADRYRMHRRVLVIKSLLYAISYCTMWFLEPFMINWGFDFKVSIITFLFFTTTVFCSAIFPLLGTLVFAILESSPSLKNGSVPPKRLLGRQKLFGTIGVGTVYAVNGTLTDLIGYRAQFLIVSITCILFAIVAWFGLDDDLLSQKALFVHLSDNQKDDKQSEPVTKTEKPSFWKNLFCLLRNLDFLLLLFVVFLIGVIGSIFNVYMSIFMANVLENQPRNGTLIGLMNSIRLLVELPIYAFGDKLLAWFGPYGVLLIGMISSTIRPFGYALFIKDKSDSYFASGFELFKGLSHTTNAIGGCVLASDLAPAMAQGTAQALFTSAHHHAASVFSGIFCSLYLSLRNVSSLSRDGQIAVYRSLFFFAGLLGCFGCILNIGRIVLGKKDRIKHLSK